MAEAAFTDDYEDGLTPDELEFQEERKTGLGGVDAAVILGLNPFSTPLTLAEEKLGRTKPFRGNRFTEAGKRLEDVIARWYADETKCKVARANRTFRLKDYPFIMGHIDRRVLGQRKVLECKSADKWTISRWGETGTDQVPDEYFVQVQHYLMFDPFDSGDLAALIGGNDLRIYEIAPDRELQEMILEAEINFWETIQRGDLPDPISSADADRRWSRDSGLSVYADDEVMQWHRELKRAQVAQKELEKKIDDCKLKIKSYMADHQVLLDPDGKRLHSWKTQNLSSFRKNNLRADHPDVYDDCQIPAFDRKTCRTKYPDIYKAYQATGRVFR